ncbi:YRO2-like plasma membrane protein [Fusarium globosum]|uniref:YRO2-like plasma membrane protein n=1 Tax=Fusarium globosum TaxID=78864 RepID=A0A8H5XT53_9HYPO|nr:YRO2-like plasma membrane protein [Fusarium globosum]
MPAVIFARNDALDVNPQSGDARLSDAGSDWLWAVTAIYIVSFLAYFALSFKPRNNERIFHYLFTIALFVGAIAYFSIASGIAYSVIPTQRNLGRALSYQIYFAKYINWVVAFPIIILALGLMSGVSWATILFNIFLAWIWIISYLCSAYTTTSYKWGFFGFGTFAYLMLAFQTLHPGRTSAARLGLSRDYLMLAGWVNLLWMLYPIAYGISDGGNVVGVTGSFIFFGILDVLLVPGLAFAFMFLSKRWDYGALNLHFTQYGRVNAGNGVFPEKRAPVAPAAEQPVPATATVAV